MLIWLLLNIRCSLARHMDMKLITKERDTQANEQKKAKKEKEKS